MFDNETVLVAGGNGSFGNHFVINPSVIIDKGNTNFKKNKLGEIGTEFVENFA